MDFKSATQSKDNSIPEVKWIDKNIAFLKTIENFKLLKDEFLKLLSKDVIEYKGNQLSLQKPDDWNCDMFGKEEWCSVGKPSNFPAKYKSDEELLTPLLTSLKELT